ncbi:cytochrome c-type biogenesis protein [Pseudosulfitobacter pseudonitzschiae]|uniref:cytochrome c-type biogenesis protein n=1 Tax=Pseudosulfitobacter pseudonitzschiae TaxID=1402135 RepID=UPI001AF5C511|nr:cytochrome c-type biogenesis protein [Pseudosulfitobacter pseudonitzschiae]MBM1814413.1 cytochrome c-type biogenesis protein CcmH [Pseudosulfitobacter pseudonitzschiae]MBM1831406.1 cytochrome c-type biogenesis protein CcmH [Pseudosulfitobacter pseudonitzschiae]MBM1836273.1 cytochrome c-type biogenesis protein CcmH [Pseudosulfitobacter pseudonitzschiae]MBM1841119.1 cytochrome c-type biogenesis protein CcmH [Pseudosulfitobacter pseudonitzschiae]MBM1845987.1 cytochrome c-type biogenesis protei
MKRLLIILLLLATPLWAVEPGEVLDDPALEARAREISQGLRCLVCRNESIDESHAPLARDLRLLVRERLVAGDTNAETVDFIVARYGEYVLLRPQATGANWLLWGAGPVMLLLALLGAGLYLRGRARSSTPQDQPLSPEESRRLAEILDE